MKRKISLSLSIFLVIIIYFLGSLVISSLTGVIFRWVEDKSLVIFIGSAMAGLATILILIRLRNVLELRVPTLKPEIRRMSPITIVLGIVMIVAMNIVINPITDFLPEWGMDFLKSHMSSGFWAMMAAVAVAPIVEEFIFRGVIQRNLTDKLGGIWGIIIASAIFGAVHGIPQQAFGAMMIGLVLGSVFFVTESLNTVITLHFLNNGITFILFMIYGETDVFEELIATNETTHIITYAASVIILILGAAYVINTAKARKVTR